MIKRELLYASSLYGAASDDGAAESVYEGLKTVRDIAAAEPEYLRLLDSTEISLDEKEHLLDEAFSGSVHLYVLNFMKLLSKKRLASMLPKCFKEYEKRYFAENNIERARVATAIELTEARKAEIVSRLETSSGKKIIADFEVDPALMGGIVIETEKTAVDASVRARLENIKNYLSKN